MALVRFREGVGQGEGAVIGADDLRRVAARMTEIGARDEAARARHHVGRQAGQLGDAVVEVLGLRTGGRTAGEGGKVVGHGEALGRGRASALKRSWRSSSVAAMAGSSRAALSAERSAPKCSAPSRKGDTMTMPERMRP